MGGSSFDPSRSVAPARGSNDPYWWLDADTGVTKEPFSTPVPAAINSAEKGTLLFLTGINAGRVLTIAGDECVLGRGREAQLLLEDPGVSRMHAIVRRRRGSDGRLRFTIEDLGSKNGTWLNGRRVARAEEMLSGDRVQVGSDLVLRFSVVDATEESLVRKLYEASTRDALTGIYNRRYFAERLSSELAYAQRHRANVAIALFDLDHFKSTNDAHGHLAGDVVLRNVAATVLRLIRVEDVFARYGGEEFVVIARGISHANVAQFAERMRSAIERLEVRDTRFGVEPLRVTISCGVASLTEMPDAFGASLGVADTLVANADQRLYAAKLAGRNRVVSGD